MTLSIDVLPAPFGPMMARISPLRMSKETSGERFHAAETTATHSRPTASTSPAATVALGRRPHAGFLQWCGSHRDIGLDSRADLDACAR